MSQSWPLLSEEERSGGEEEAASEFLALDSVLTSSEQALPVITSILGANVDRNYTPQAGAASTEEGGEQTTTDDQHPLLLSSRRTLSQSVISDVSNGDGSVSDDAIHMYLRMLAKAHREVTQAYTVAVQYPTFWVVSEVLSEDSKTIWRLLTDSHTVDTTVLRKVLIPRLHQGRWQLFVIDRDLRMIKLYCPTSGTVRIDDRVVSSTIDFKNLLLADQVLCRP